MNGPDDLAGGGDAGGEDLGSGADDLATGGETDTGYESGSMEDTAMKTLREINARGEGDETNGEGGEDKPGTVKVREHTRQVKPKPAAAAAAPEIDPTTGKPKVAAEPAATEGAHKILPTTWKRELATAFQALPENVQQEIHRREADARNGVAMYRRDADFAKELSKDFVEPYLQDFEAVGLPPKEAVQSIMQGWSGLVRGDKAARVGMFSQLLENFGITPSDLGAPRDGGNRQQGQGDDPRLTVALQRIDQLEGNIRSEQQQRQHREISGLQTEWARFRQDPANEFVDTVHQTMQRLLHAGEAESFKDAYDKACLLDANVRAKIEERKNLENRNRETAGAAVARRAAGVRVASRGSPSAAAKPGTIEDTIRDTFRQISAR